MDGLFALLQVIMIDIILAGDNALVIGALSARLPADRRGQAVALGIAAAIGIRLFFTATAAWLMLIPAIGLIGGLLLFWIAWKLWKEQQADAAAPDGTAAPTNFLAAVRGIILADISMSLDNILGVAGAAKGHAFALVIGLVLSMVMMGTAANWIAGQMSKRPWLIYIGIAAIVLAGGKMIVEAF
ncbi:YjbE family putative metal transport protein [Novosphingobium rosa]|uniref:YjbE family putative metal transport protein n=1 Tax=Novosphingobium rosa TaxID=76978 RepID=UPI0012ED8F25|nr:YjbE family putative metal transport protein [Novosphingobium rosa]